MSPSGGFTFQKDTGTSFAFNLAPNSSLTRFFPEICVGRMIRQRPKWPFTPSPSPGRFYSGFFWRHPLLKKYEYIMRLDTKIQFHCDLVSASPDS